MLGYGYAGKEVAGAESLSYLVSSRPGKAAQQNSTLKV